MTASEPTPRRADAVRKRPLSKSAQQGLYRRQRSFVDFLPWVEALPEHKAILLADGVSVGAVLEVTRLGPRGVPRTTWVRCATRCRMPCRTVLMNTTPRPG